MSWLRIFVVALLVAPVAPALAAPLMPSQAPTMQDVDPGIDHTARDRDLPSEFHKQSVYYRTEQPPGTIIVNTADRYLYLIMGNGVAMRYGVGVGRDGFQWGGIQKITVKREWPDSSALDGWRSGQSARSACDEPRRDGLSYPWHQCARNDRTSGVVRLLPVGQ
jgi:lipoprotein-anchoring transpeptidase ErfK/SrfK